MSRVLAVTVALVALAAPASRGADPDPWSGKTRSDVLEMLGRPDKTRRTAAGETLIYRMLRFSEDVEPIPGMVLLELPGAGRVGRVPRFDDPLRNETLEIGPTGYDEHGRPIAGGMTRRSSYTRSWGNDGDAAGQDPAQKPPRPAGKAKLVFRIAADGTVADWSVSSKGRD